MRRLVRNRRGSASVEFAFLSLFFFATIMVALDFGLYVQQKLKLGAAVEQGAMLAYGAKLNAAGVASYVNADAGTKAAVTTTVTCNGTATCGDGKCSCITASGGFTIVATCNAACAGSSAYSGNYMKVAAAATYQAMVVPDRFLGGGTLAQAAVVRLP